MGTSSLQPCSGTSAFRVPGGNLLALCDKQAAVRWVGCGCYCPKQSPVPLAFPAP